MSSHCGLIILYDNKLAIQFDYQCKRVFSRRKRERHPFWSHGTKETEERYRAGWPTGKTRLNISRSESEHAQKRESGS